MPSQIELTTRIVPPPRRAGERETGSRIRIQDCAYVARAKRQIRQRSADIISRAFISPLSPRLAYSMISFRRDAQTPRSRRCRCRRRRRRRITITWNFPTAAWIGSAAHLNTESMSEKGTWTTRQCRQGFDEWLSEFSGAFPDTYFVFFIQQVGAQHFRQDATILALHALSTFDGCSNHWPENSPAS